MITEYDIITGEKIQKLAELYIGTNGDFMFNPKIKYDKTLKLEINKWNNIIDNPKIIFCYPHNLQLFSEKVSLLKNKFILITHNSDQNIYKCEYIYKILNCDKLIVWFGQNLTFTTEKLKLLPIGIANSQWPHGEIKMFTNIQILNNINNKTEFIYFNFNIYTNEKKRKECYNKLSQKIKFLSNINPSDNIIRLSKYKFCICPEGNGLDTHRIWECFYVNTIPIVEKNEFTLILKKKNLPIVLLDDWNDINYETLQNIYYDIYKKFENKSKFLLFSEIVNEICK